jgi:hypothetical protein
LIIFSVISFSVLKGKQRDEMGLIIFSVISFLISMRKQRKEMGILKGNEYVKKGIKKI